ncbi:MAG: HAMP domain-containing protein [Marinilabiliaceae bacterium]|nr:HAMP domain-containing protein [Marinilabiliaceae bacterium]
MKIRDIFIRTRLLLAFSIIIFCVALVGFIGWSALTRTRTIVNVFNHLKEGDHQLLIAQIKVLKFTQYEDKKHLNDAKENLRAAEKEIDAASKYRVISNDEINKVKKEILTYEETLQNYARLKEKQKENDQKWTKEGDQLDDILANNSVLNQLGNQRQKLLNTYDHLRISIWMFIAHPFNKKGDINNAVADQVATHIENIHSYIKQANARYGNKKGNQIIKEAEADIVAYKKSFNEYMAELTQQEHALAVMQESGINLDKFSKQIVASALQQEDKIISGAEFTSLLILALSLIIGAVVARLLSTSIVKPLSRGVRLAGWLAQGQLYHQFEVHSRDEIGQLGQAMKRMSDKIRHVVGEITNGSDQIEVASEQMTSTSQELSHRASEQAASLEEISTSVEEMVANINQNSRNAEETKNKSEDAYQSIQVANEWAEKAMEAHQRITDKISVIDTISNQTNILALNAAVEAARAGENGKGFTVVATEVRRLAEMSKAAAKEIVVLAKESRELSVSANKQLHGVLPAISSSNNLIKEISASTVEQREAVNQINTAIQQLNVATQQNAAGSEEMAAGAEELNAQTAQLRALIGYFRLNETATQEESSEPVKHVTMVKKQTDTTSAQNQKPGTSSEFEIQLDSKDYERF